MILHIERARTVGDILFKQFTFSKEGIFGQRNIPGDEKPDMIKKGSYEHIMFITMTVSIDYMRDAIQLWNAAKATFNDGSTRWLFNPSEVSKRPADEVIEAMRKYKLSKKPNRDAINIWMPIAKSFDEIFGSNPLNLIKECDHDAYTLLTRMQTNYKSYFPYLSGEKILPLWILFLHEIAGIKMKNINKIPIPVDVHIARATFTTGCITGKLKRTIHEVREAIDKVWEEACKGTRYYRLQFDFPLWNLSRYGCSYRTNSTCIKKNFCPVSQFCVRGKVQVSQNRGIEINTKIRK